MAESNKKRQLTKKIIKNEIKKEKEKYMRNRRVNIFAVLLVLFAVSLVFFTKEETKPSTAVEKDSFSVYEGTEFDNKAVEVTIRGTKIFINNKKYTTVEEFKKELFNTDYTVGDVIVLNNDKAVQKIYKKVKDIIIEMDDIKVIEN